MNVLQALLGSGARLLRTVACAQALAAQLQLHRHGRVVQCLVVGVADDEGHVVYALFVHVVHSVAATAAHADDLDDAVLLLGDVEIL